MTDKEIKEIYTGICKNIESRRLKPAFDMLGRLIPEKGLGVYYDEYRSMEETYHYMLKYTVEGVSDPERQKIYQKLIISVLDLTDKITGDLSMKFSVSAEYDKKRSFREHTIKNPESYIAGLESHYLSSRAQSPEKNKHRPGGSSESKGNSGTGYYSAKAETVQQQKIQRLFYHIWFSDKLSPEESGQWQNFIGNGLFPVSYRAFMITAITLGLLRCFDQEKFMLLFDYFDADEPAIGQRALAGLLISLYKYDSRMPFYPEITGRLKILNEDPGFKSNLERIIIQFIRSKETEKLQQRIRDEILPEMIRISPNLKNKISLESLMEERLSEEKNPEWEDIFKDSPGLLNKMEEFSEMQMKGADVFMGSFSMLKSFPFFNEMGNWFMPFFPDNPDISDTVDTSDPNIINMLDAIERAPILCNSDKYSFCLSIQKLPRQNLEFMTQAMKAEMEQVKEITDDEELTDPGKKAEFVSNQYIQDLYRFYKLFPRKADFEDIFNWKLDFHNKIVLGEILREDRKVLRNIAEYYFMKEHYEDAAGIFSDLLVQDQNGELYQKLAWCHQKRGNFEAALDGYLKADLYDVNQLWTIKKIALCYRNLKKPAKALKYYQSAEKLDPDNLGNQLNIGHCLLELERYDEALKCYFKVEYLSPGNKKVWRPIAWCSFLTGKKDQAEKYLLRLIEDEPNKHDLINMGHVQWSLGNRREAIGFYRRSIQAEGGFSEEEFHNVFREDIPHLLTRGVDGDDIPIMLDQLSYFLEE